tara:strand:+ start:40 stop:411 length:372 start_codon:yes stop_codon:yes gene_type:complete
MRDKIIAFDLDDVLCTRTSNEGDIEKYKSCLPNVKMISILNKCYEEGYKIVIYTARGMSVNKGNIHDIYSNLYELTISQLDKWGIAYHQLVMGKLHFDLLIDDKVVNSSQIKTFSDVEKYLGE